MSGSGDATGAIKVGVIGGSGLGAAMAAELGGASTRRHEIDTPFGKPSDAVVETSWHGLPLFFLSRHGPGHLLNPSQVPYRANVFALKALGVTHVIASGAVGSLREEFKPRELVIPDQVIDKTIGRANTFFEGAAVHVEFAEPFDPVLRQILLDARDGVGFPVHDRACYVCMEGPAFSTRAESLMHRLWGGDLIGMTAMPEAKLAREAEIAYAMVALVTDYDCWRTKPADATTTPGNTPEPKLEADPFVLLKEIIANLEAATTNAVSLIRRAVERMAERRDELLHSPARHALELGIWSDKSRIPPDEVRRLAPLWIHYFKGTDEG
jgi:5'-methylthioadenosine phosphorylase